MKKKKKVKQTRGGPMHIQSHYLMNGVIVGLIALAQFGCGGDQDKTPNPAKRPERAQSKVQPDASGPEQARKPDFVVSAPDFAREFLANSDKATAKYKDKVIEVEGEVRDVFCQSGGGDALIRLAGVVEPESQGSLMGVWGHAPPKQLRRAFELSRKQKVKLTGIFSDQISSYVMLDKCTFEEISKSEIIKVTAEEIAKEFSKDALEAEKKYADKDILVTGKVESLKTDGNEKVTLRESDKIRVSVYVFYKDTSYLRVGQATRLRCNSISNPIVGGANLQAGEVIIHDGGIAGTK